MRSVSSLAVFGWLGGLGLALLATACTFKPKVPDAVITCAEDADCPEDLVCHAKLQRCCREGSCGDLPNTTPGARPDAGRTDASSSTSGDAAPAAPEQAQPTPVPISTPDGGALPDDGGARGDASDASSAAALLSCSGTDTPIDPGPGRQTFCTIYARASDVNLSIHSMSPGDAVSTRTHGVCNARLPLLQEATAPNGTGRAVTAETTMRLVDVVQEFKALCTKHQGKLVGMVANQWARQATNLPEVKAQVRTGTGLELDVPSQAGEMEQLYLGVTRQKRGRVMVFETTASIDVAYWPKDVPALTRLSMPMSWTDVDSMYVANMTHATFEDARRALRGRLVRELQGPLNNLRGMIEAGTLEAGVVVGPADATIPLAVRGGLRDAMGTWDSVAQFEKKRSEALVIPSPYGRIFSTAPLAPGEIDGFFGTLDDAQWKQLREDPRRTAYGYELFFMTVVLDVLADETKASEFAFVFANAHLGYLFSKLLPPPS